MATTPRSTTLGRVLAALVVLTLLGLPGVAVGAKVRSIEVDEVTVSATRVVGGDSLTGTVSLNQLAPADIQVFVFPSDGPPIADVPGNPLTIPAGQTTTNFTVTTSVSTVTNRVVLQGLLADGTSTVTPEAEFFIVPTAQTDLIEVTKATMSKSGTLSVTAASDNPDAVLTAEFNGEPVPGESRDGRFRGQLVLPQATSGIVEVRSNLGGCGQRNPFGSSGSQVC
jgi:hypothetical protein